MMEIIGWVILGIYVLGIMPFAVVIARGFAIDDYNMTDDMMMRIVTLVMAFFISFFWPLVIPIGWMYKKVFKRVPDDR